MHLDTFLQDLRVGLRVLVRERSFCLLAVFVLALGICGVTTMFSVVNGVLLRGFDFPNASRLTAINFIDPAQTNAFGTQGQIFALDYVELREEQTSFEKLAAYLNGSTVNLSINGIPQRLTGAYVTDEFMSALGVRPVKGRDFAPSDNQPGAEKVALISDGLWKREFGGAENVIGRAVRINGKPATVIGVMPPGFQFPVNEDIWIPLFNEFPPQPRNSPRQNAPAVMGLLRQGLSLDQAAAEFDRIAKRQAAAHPDTNKTFNVAEVRPLIDAFTGPQLKGILWTMLAFCVGLLLIACVNVMNMQFARATLRGKELAVRSSLGASRLRLIRQMLTESLLVAVLGAVVGIASATYAIDLLDSTVRNLENPPPAWMAFRLDLPVLAFTVVATLIAALVSGFIPAWMSSRASAIDALKEGGRGNTSRTVLLMTRGLVVFQIVVTCVLLIGSLLQVRSILAQQAIDFGYDTSGLMSARMGLMDGDYPDNASRKVFFDRLLRELRAHPEFEAAALTNRFRMVFSGNGPVEIEGREYKADGDRPNANFESVSEGFFATTGQRLLEGRDFNADDLDTRLPVAVVNAAFARRHFGNESAVGRRFRTVGNNGQLFGPWRTIVGVVSTIRMLGPFNNPNVDDSGFYVPFYAGVFGPVQEEPFINQFTTVVVRPRPGQRAEGLAAVLRKEVARVDPNLPLYFVGTPAAHIDGFIAQNRIVATLFSLFGVVAVILASVGLYGVMSFSVNQRTQEFGVRMALGADAGRILGMVLRQGAWQLGVGLVLGLGLAYAVAVLGGAGIQGVLFGVTPSDPATYAGVTALLVVVSTLATWVPARRATRVDPQIALRAE